MQVAIIGAGASGLLCAIECAKAGLDVTLFEQNTKPAKKILVSGNGRCNISNTTLTPNDFFSQNPDFVSYAIQQFDFYAFERLMQKMGLLLTTLEDGRAYPLSNEAKSVANTLLQQAHNLGVKLVTEEKITSLAPLLTKYDKVVVATGSEAASHLGGCGDGYTFAKEIGHTIIPTYPSLVQLELDSPYPVKMAGVKMDGEVTLYINGVKEQSVRGDILFTNYGVSGFAILDISQMASEALLNHYSVDISLNLLPSLSAQKIVHHLQNSAQNNPHFSLFDLLLGLVPVKIANTLLESLKLQNTTPLNTKLAKKIANQITNWRFEVQQTHGFRHAEVSGGGVDTSEIDPKTFRSKKNGDVYFIGEVLDVVGRRGGFNFAFAWASGYLCAQDIIKNRL